jgi:hypothetical protein
MPKVSISAALPASAARVWHIVGDFNAFPMWHPAVQSSELSNGGTTRTLQLCGGGKMVESLEKHNDQERVYSYAIVDSPLPVKECRATLRIVENEDNKATVTWSTQFVASGAPESIAIDAMQSICQAGLQNLRDMFLA